MCILFTTDHFETKDTLLIVSPLRTPPSSPQAWQLSYINSISRKTPTPYTPKDGPSSASPLMVVPLPNPHAMSESDFTLFEIDRVRATRLRAAATTLSTSYLPEAKFDPPSAFGSISASSLFGAKAPLVVQQVGNYRVTVAPTLTDLETRAPWSRFAVPPQAATRIISDVRERYRSAPFAFIIAEGDSAGGIKEGGFSVLYRDARANPSFFPTSHEPPLRQTSAIAHVNLDVTLVALGAVLRPLSILEPAQHSPLRMYRIDGNRDMKAHVWQPAPGVVLRADDTLLPDGVPTKWTAVSDLFRALPMHGAGDMHHGIFVEHEPVRLATLWKLEGSFPNRDVRARKATAEDVAVAGRAYADLGAWLSHRAFKDGMGYDSWPFNALRVHWPRLAKIDVVLALLGRQLSDPGLNDRVSDVPCRLTGQKQVCGPLAYINLDLPNIDLDEASYEQKDGWARLVSRQGSPLPIDTAGTTYIRICAKLGCLETVAMRTVQVPADNEPQDVQTKLGHAKAFGYNS